MDYLRQGIHLRGYAQKNPKQEYKREAFEMFERLLEEIKQEFITVLTLIQVRTDEEMEAYHQAQSSEEFEMKHEEFSGFGNAEGAAQEEESHTPYVREGRKVGRNEPCPCGSGKKYKQCHGKLQ
jgi:preprotein translocase subunit SecA